MTHVYDDYGRRIAVTAVQAGPCTVLRLREPARHGYRAIQLGFEPIKASGLTKPEQGQFAKTGTGPFRHVREFRLPAGQAGLRPVSDTPPQSSDRGESDTGELKVGQQLTVDLFNDYELVDVTGVSIGKGFQGGMKRWGWSGGPKTHGSMSHRAPGSIGSTTTPGRVWRGHHLPGHMGMGRVTVQNVRIVRRDLEHHLLLIEGAVPGAEQGLVMVRKSQKRPEVLSKPRAFQVVVEEEEKMAKGAKAIKKK